MNKFDLQLFAEGEVAPSATAQPVETTPVAVEPVKTEPKPDFNTLSTKDQGDFFEKQFIKKEPVVEKKEPVKEPTKEPVKEPVTTTPPVAEPAPTTTEVTPAPVAKEVPYTPEEIATTGIDKLDPARLPEELKPYYKSMLADYTRKTQAVAEQKRQAEQPPAPVRQQPKAIDRLLQERAQDIAQVERILNEGNTGDHVAFEPFDPDHQYIMKRVSDVRVYNENQQNNIVQTNERMVQREQSNPEFQDVMKQAEKELVALAGSSVDGLNMANRIIGANERLVRRQASQDDLELLQTFMDNTKTKYKASKVKPVIPVIPAKPVVASESTGSSIPTEPKEKRFNPKNAAKLDSKGLANLMGVFANGG